MLDLLSNKFMWLIAAVIVVALVAAARFVPGFWAQVAETLKLAVLSRIVADWKATAKTYSVFVFGAIMVSPELFQAFTSLMDALTGMGAGDNIVLPKAFTDFVRAMGAIGLVVRFWRQSKQSIVDAAKQLAAEQAAAEQAAKEVQAQDPAVTPKV